MLDIYIVSLIHVLKIASDLMRADVWDDPGEGDHWNPCSDIYLNDWELDDVVFFLKASREVGKDRRKG